MKKQMSLFIWAVAAFGMAPVLAEPMSGVRNNDMGYERYETRSVTRSYSNNARTGNVGSGRSQMYRDYDNQNRASGNNVRTYSNTQTYNNVQTYDNSYARPSYTARSYSYNNGNSYGNSGYTRSYSNYDNNVSTARTTTRNETVRRELKRKYYLAHPFFQPTEGKFGSITDVSYNHASYDIHVLPVADIDFSDVDATWSMKQFAIKEDLSYGITDRIGLVGMARYDTSDYKLNWSHSLDDKMSDSGINIYGIGIQGRFVDTDEWIATLSGYYERQQDVANEFIFDLRAGYKISKSTIYGFGRGWLVDFDGNTYGNGIVGEMEDGTVGGFFIAYDTNVDTKMFFEGGIGVFSVLNEDWTFNLEATLGNYDWHNQGAIRAALGWQPDDWFALNVYARMSFYDTAEGARLASYGTYVDENDVLTEGYLGKSEIDKYSEYSIGGQVIFYF